MKRILVINAGSSSMKWMLFNQSTFEVQASGMAERIKVDGSLTLSFNGVKEEKLVKMDSHTDAVKEILAFWKEKSVITDVKEIQAIGFRVVHGGTYFTKPTVITDDVIEKIEECTAFAPLHNPGAISAINAFKKLLGGVKMVACFDTSFHQTMEKVNYLYPINRELAEKLHIRKFGFHGISHQYIAEKMESILGHKDVNIVNLHIGNGASLAAIKDGKCIDTSMGFTPLAGIMMGTRSGDIDPSIHEYVMNKTGLTIKEFTSILNKESGLAGVSEVSSDFRDITKAIAEGNTKAKEAFDLYAQRIVDYTATYANKVGKSLEAIVFTAGVGENVSALRAQIINKLELIDTRLNEEANLDRSFSDYNEISVKGSKVRVFVVRTNEELMIAEECNKL